MEIMEHNITKPSIIRLARRAGVKSMADECNETVKKLIDSYLTEIISTALIVNSDIYEALRIRGYNVSQSTDLGTTTCTK